MAKERELQFLFEQIGNGWRYQTLQGLLLLLPSMAAGLHTLSFAILAATPRHRCFIPELDTTESITWNADSLSPFIPITEDKEIDSCRVFNDTNGTNYCSQWVFDQVYHPTSRVIEWEMVCNRRWIRATILTVFMLGVLVGAFTFGLLADRIGRKRVLSVCIIGQVILSFSCAFCPDEISFTILRFFLGTVSCGGGLVTSFVLILELMHDSRRTLWGMLFQGSFGIGIMLVPVWGVLFRDRFTLDLILAAHSVLMVPLLWFVDESIRWLWSQGRKLEAINLVKRAAAINKNVLVNDFNSALQSTSGNTEEIEMMNYTYEIEQDSESKKSYGVLDLLRTKRLRGRTINIFFNWFTNSLVYYGLSLNTGKLRENPFLMLFLVGLAELPAYALVYLLMDRCGRRPLLATLMITGGLACIIAPQLPKGKIFSSEWYWASVLSIGLVMLGKLLISGSFAVVYNYTAELFPTVVRNSAIGVGSTGARLSGALCPLLSLLLFVGFCRFWSSIIHLWFTFSSCRPLGNNTSRDTAQDTTTNIRRG